MCSQDPEHNIIASPKNTPFLIPGRGSPATVQSKGVFADALTSRIWRSRGHPDDLGGWALNAITCVLVRGRQRDYGRKKGKVTTSAERHLKMQSVEGGGRGLRTTRSLHRLEKPRKRILPMEPQQAPYPGLCSVKLVLDSGLQN